MHGETHLILKLTIRLTNRVSGLSSVGKLSLVDLAGSERVGKSGAEGDRLKEAQVIHKTVILTLTLTLIVTLRPSIRVSQRWAV